MYDDFDSEEDQLLPFCAFCSGSEPMKLYRDALNNHWCEEHRYRGKVIDWGLKHNWPLLNLNDGTISVDRSGEFMVIPDGAYYWQACLVISKNEEVGYLAEAIIDVLESQEQAS